VSEGEPLTGDGVTQGIVRIGDTVRRPLRPFSLTVQAYLAHLRDAGFTGAPLSRGFPRLGRAGPGVPQRAEAWLREAAPAITARLGRTSPKMLC
jgi:hypothetical protein